MICSFCIVAQRRGFVKLLQRNSNKRQQFGHAKRLLPREKLPAERADEGKVCQRCPLTGACGKSALIRPCGAAFSLRAKSRLRRLRFDTRLRAQPRGGRLRLSKKVRLPLGPLCEGAPAAAGGGENCTATRNISGYGKVLSLRPYGAPPSQREVFRHAAPSPEEEGLNRSISPLACGPEMRYNTLNRIV